MTPYLGLQRKLLPTAQVSSLTTGSVTLPSARQSVASTFEAIQSFELVSSTDVVWFVNIPQYYEHLQLRITSKSNRATYNYDSHQIRFNNVSTANTYIETGMNNDPGGGSGAQSYAAGRTYFFVPLVGTSVRNQFGYTIMDIFDYADTSYNTSVRFVGGSEGIALDGGYRSYTLIASGTFVNTGAVTTIRIQCDAASYLAGSTFSLYGVRG